MGESGKRSGQEAVYPRRRIAAGVDVSGGTESAAE